MLDELLYKKYKWIDLSLYPINMFTTLKNMFS